MMNRVSIPFLDHLLIKRKWCSLSCYLPPGIHRRRSPCPGFNIPPPGIGIKAVDQRKKFGKEMEQEGMLN